MSWLTPVVNVSTVAELQDALLRQIAGEKIAVFMTPAMDSEWEKLFVRHVDHLMQLAAAAAEAQKPVPVGRAYPLLSALLKRAA